MSLNFQLKRVFFAAIAFGVSNMAAIASAQSEARLKVTISVTDIAAHRGFIMAALYDEAGWAAASPAVVKREPAAGDVVTIVLHAPTPGRYGIRLYHDVDGDGALNANLFGVPTEPYGFSNNAGGSFGPPDFSAAAFDIESDGAVQTISLR